MRRSIALAIALATALSFSLAAAQMSAAEEAGNPIILPEPTKTAPLKFTATSGQLSFENANLLLLECLSSTSQGEFTSKRAGTITVSFKECAWMTHTCQTKGSPSGVISLPNETIHIVAFKYKEALRLGMVITLPKPVPVECWLGTEFRGSLLGLVEGPASGVATKTAKLVFKRNRWVQELKECDLDKEFCLEGGVHKKFFPETLLGASFVEMGTNWMNEIKLEKEASFTF